MPLLSFRRFASLVALAFTTGLAASPLWTPDNGNGTYTNPLFNEDFSDPDIIRVGNDFYLTGSTMHVMPGLPVLHSTDLVNWELASYAFDRLDLGGHFQLTEDHESYGKGIWAPCLRYHNGTFYLFANVNGRGTQVFQANDPKGPWKHHEMKNSFHDLSVLFDDDGKVYVVWGYQDLHLAELNADLTDAVPGTERVLFAKDAGMGEGSHLYKTNGKYFILSALWDGPMRMACARADKIDGPYEVTIISKDEDFGLPSGWHLRDVWGRSGVEVLPPNPLSRGRMSLHQGGIVSTPQGEWWGISMMEANALGRTSCLSPITWQDGWPYFGLPGNLTRTPRTWTKPSVPASPVRVPFEHSDDFSNSRLQPVWQWNHLPDDSHWSLTEVPGSLALHSLPAADFLHARNSLTQHALGPFSEATVEIDVSRIQEGDTAGLALLTLPTSQLGVVREKGNTYLELKQQADGVTLRAPALKEHLWLRVTCDFLKETATFGYSTNGKDFTAFGTPSRILFQLKTFQGVRWSLFAYNTTGKEGGVALIDRFDVTQPYTSGLLHPLPYGKTIHLRSKASDVGAVDAVTVQELGLGRVAFKKGATYLKVDPEKASVSFSEPAAKTDVSVTFQWMETLDGDVVLLSLATNRFLRIAAASGELRADSPGAGPDPKDEARWRVTE